MNPRNWWCLCSGSQTGNLRKKLNGKWTKICCEKHHYRLAGKSFADSSQRGVICQLAPNSNFFSVLAIAVSVCSRAICCFIRRLATFQKFGLVGKCAWDQSVCRIASLKEFSCTSQSGLNKIKTIIQYVPVFFPSNQVSLKSPKPRIASKLILRPRKIFLLLDYLDFSKNFLFHLQMFADIYKRIHL